MSVLRPTLNELSDPVVVVLDDEVDFFEPQPAAATAKAATSTASGMSLFTGPPTVLDCGAKTCGRFYFPPRALRRAAGARRAARGCGASRPAAARRVARASARPGGRRRRAVARRAARDAAA